MQGSPKKHASHINKLKAGLEEKRLASGSHLFTIDALRDGSVSASQLRAVLEEQGVVVIKGAFTQEAFAVARQALREAYRSDVEPQLKPQDRPAAATDILELVKVKKHWAGTKNIIGNKTFGYLLAQPESKEDAPRITFDGGLKVAVQPCSAYKANLALLEHDSSQLTLAALLSITGNKTGMVSQDSAKICRGDLTKPHVDIYGTAETRINRVQAMAIGPGEGNVRLCFARFTHLPKIQQLVCDSIENVDFYKRTGFLAIPTEHRKSFLHTLKEADVLHAGAPGELIIWKTGVVHVEMQRDQRSGELLYKNDNKTTTERYIVGTHQPYNLTPRQLLEIGCIADKGFLFHCYNSLNKGNAAGDNSVHLKTTQWKQPRVRPQSEKDRLQAAIEVVGDSVQLQTWMEQQSARKLHCLGVSQSAADLFTDEAALRVFNSEN